MDPLSELQDDLTLDDPSQALNQLKLASIDEKNWPSDEMPDFPKSGGHGWMAAALGALEGEPPPPALPVEERPWEDGVGANRSAPRLRADQIR